MEIVRMRLSAACLAAILGVVPLGAGADASEGVFGTWLTREGKSKVVIEPCDGKICGHIVWLKEPLDDGGQPKLDKNNKKEDLRQRPLIGLPLLTGFVPGDKQGIYEDGDIYNPEDGKTYNSEMALQEDGNLKVEGCVLFFCKEQIWTPVK